MFSDEIICSELKRITIPTCDLCPAAFFFTGAPVAHIEGHERWKKEGRPPSFEEALARGDIEDLSGSKERH
jgi:hypothetical protein